MSGSSDSEYRFVKQARPRLLRRAFTLIELVVVIVIVVVLMALAVSGFGRVLNRGRAAACIGNLQEIGAGIGAYAADNDNLLPFGPQAAAFGMSGNLYTSTGAPTSLITLTDGSNVGLGLTLPYLKQPKVFFCPGADQPVDVAAALADVGKKQVQSCYYYRHAGNTAITDIGGKGVVPPRFGALGDDRLGQPIRAIVMDTQFLCVDGLRGFGVVPRTHHNKLVSNVLYTDGHVAEFRDLRGALNVDITDGSNIYRSYDLILRTFEAVDTGELNVAAGNPTKK